MAAVAILIPINPAKEEKRAPPTKAIDPQGYPQSVSVEIKIARTTTKILTHEYCLFRKAIEPFLIASDKLCTFSSVTLIDKILFAKKAANARPNNAAIIEPW